MNIIDIEVFLIVSILILMIDFYIKYKNKITLDFKLFYKLSFSVLLFISFNSLINILHMFSDKTKIIFILLCYFLLAKMPLFINDYAAYYYSIFENKKGIRNNFKNFFLAFYIIIIFIFLIFQKNNIITSYNKYILFISIIPLIIQTINIRKINGSFRLFLIMIIPVLGILISIFSYEYIIIYYSYSISILLLYLHKNTITLTIDPLTNIFNRRILDSIDFKLIGNKVIACYIFDVDKFKYINDNFGHKKGDMILKDIATILKSSTRKSDYTIRYGGDEFLIIAYIRSKDDIDIITRKIKEKINDYNKKSAIKISISFGYDTYNPENYISFDDFIQKIDKEMYKNKVKSR